MLTTRKLIVLTAIVAVVLTWLKISGFIDYLYDKDFYYEASHVFRETTPFKDIPDKKLLHLPGAIAGFVAGLFFWALIVLSHVFGIIWAIDWCSVKRKK